MELPISMRQNQYVSPPRAPTLATHGSVAAFATSTAANYLDLRTVGFQGARSLAVAGQQKTGAVDPYKGDYITVRAITSDLGVVFGPTAASVSTASVPAMAGVGAITAGVYASAVGCCHRIPAGQEERFLLQPGVDLFMGFVASAAGQCDLFQSSPDCA